MAKNTKEKRKLIIFVPAFMLLWSKHDEVNKHYRRYSRKQLLQAMIKGTNMKIKFSSYWNFTLFFPVFAMRVISKVIKPKKSEQGDLKELNHLINSIIYCIIRIENRIIKMGIKFPVGVSCLAVCKKY